MLTLIVNPQEGWDEINEKFVYYPGGVLKLEHSLLSISKWESIYKKPFLSRKEKTREETIDYIKCMTINSVKSDIYEHITNENIDFVSAYMDNPMTASTINKKNSKGHSSEQITSELIYYWMISLGIPFECEKWHLNRLMTLIEICNLKNKPSKKMPMNSMVAKRRALNASRRSHYRTRG